MSALEPKQHYDRPGKGLEDEAADQLVIQCAMCRRNYPSGLTVGDQSSGGDTSQVQVHECPYCGFTAAYGASDYRHGAE